MKRSPVSWDPPDFNPWDISQQTLYDSRAAKSNICNLTRSAQNTCFNQLKRWQSGLDHLCLEGFQLINACGLKPQGFQAWVTSILTDGLRIDSLWQDWPAWLWLRRIYFPICGPALLVITSSQREVNENETYGLKLSFFTATKVHTPSSLRFSLDCVLSIWGEQMKVVQKSVATQQQLDSTKPATKLHRRQDKRRLSFSARIFKRWAQRFGNAQRKRVRNAVEMSKKRNWQLLPALLLSPKYDNLFYVARNSTCQENDCCSVAFLLWLNSARCERRVRHCRISERRICRNRLCLRYISSPMYKSKRASITLSLIANVLKLNDVVANVVQANGGLFITSMINTCAALYEAFHNNVELMNTCRPLMQEVEKILISMGRKLIPGKVCFL